MLVLFWVLLFLVGSCLVLLVPALWGKQIYDTYRGTRTVNCPETHAPVKVRFNAMRAAITGLSGKPRLGLTDCSRWPVHADCRQECIPDAELVSADALKPAAPSQAKRFFHLPVLVGAGGAWVFGVAWHSQYAFRPRWMHA